MADLVLEAINAPAWVLQAMMLVVASGFIAAIIIAWAYELTPEGIKRERDVERGQSITHITGRKLDRITHHVHIFEMNGESYRLKHSKKKKRGK